MHDDSDSDTDANAAGSGDRKGRGLESNQLAVGVPPSRGLQNIKFDSVEQLNWAWQFQASSEDPWQQFDCTECLILEFSWQLYQAALAAQKNPKSPEYQETPTGSSDDLEKNKDADGIWSLRFAHIIHGEVDLEEMVLVKKKMRNTITLIPEKQVKT